MYSDEKWEITGKYTFPSRKYGLGATPTWFRVRRGEKRYIVNPNSIRVVVEY